MEQLQVKLKDGTVMYMVKTDTGYEEVEKKELIGGVFERGEFGYFIRKKNGQITKNVVGLRDEDEVNRGLVWKTKEEAERKVEIDRLIAKYRITDREVLEDGDIPKYYIDADTSNQKLKQRWCQVIVAMSVFKKEKAEKLLNLITYEEWTKYVLLWR